MTHGQEFIAFLVIPIACFVIGTMWGTTIGKDIAATELSKHQAIIVTNCSVTTNFTYVYTPRK